MRVIDSEEINKTTIFGYPLRDLLVFASACREKGISEKDLRDFCTGVENGYFFGVEEARRAVETNLERTLSAFAEQKEKVNGK